MRAVIRNFMSMDVDDLDNWVPVTESWVVTLRLLIGPNDGPGEESFDLTVCNLVWLTEQIRGKGPFNGRHYLFVESFDWPNLKKFVEHQIMQCEGKTWLEVAEKVARFAFWEFEDYRQ